MDINAFMANFQGGARANRYKVILNFPFEVNSGLSLTASVGAVLGPIAGGTSISSGSPSPLFQFMCKGAALPGSQVNSIDVPYMGRVYKVAGDRTFTDWNVNVLNDENFAIRNAFERWMNAINSHVGNVRTPTTNGYYANAEIYQLSTTGSVIKKYKIHSLFPTDLGEISVGFDQNDTVEEFTVNFALAYWTSDTTT